MKIKIIMMVALLALVLACITPPTETRNIIKEVDDDSTGRVGVTTITVENFAFNPTDVEVAVGTTVEWTNEDNVEHTITFDGGPTIDEVLPPGGMVTHTFTQAGAYSYHCTPHPGMQGKVIVR